MKPKYARALLEGRKTIEVRRKFPSIAEGTLIVVYASSPERAVLGTLRLNATARVHPTEVWARYAGEIEIEEADVARYLTGAAFSTLLMVDIPDTWLRPVTLAELRSLLGVEPPQSFRYLDETQVAVLRNYVRGPVCLNG